MNLRRSIGLVCAVAVLSGTAWAAGVVTNTLTAHRIVAQADGSELREVATAAHPGDVIEYDVDFRNSGAAAVHALQPTLPIPAGATLVAGSVHPAGALASLDGTTYAAMPLLRQVRADDGTLSERAVPIAEYRYLRWAPADLAGNGALTLSARVVLVK